MSFNVCGNKYWLPQTNSIGSNMKVLLFLLKLDHHIKIHTLKKKKKKNNQTSLKVYLFS